MVNKNELFLFFSCIFLFSWKMLLIILKLLIETGNKLWSLLVSAIKNTYRISKLYRAAIKEYENNEIKKKSK